MNEIMGNELSGFLFARPSFIEGIARIFDFGGTLQEYNRSQSVNQADNRALRMDAEVIGDDLRNLLLSYSETIPDDANPTTQK